MRGEEPKGANPQSIVPKVSIRLIGSTRICLESYFKECILILQFPKRATF